MEDGNHNNENDTTILLTADEFLKTGLKLVGYKRHRIRRAQKISNVERFVGHYRSIPCICASIWEDLQTTAVEEARIPVEHLNVAFFLMAMHHFKRYPTEVKREGIFDISLKWGRDKVWYYVKKIQELVVFLSLWPGTYFLVLR